VHACHAAGDVPRAAVSEPGMAWHAPHPAQPGSVRSSRTGASWRPCHHGRTRARVEKDTAELPGVGTELRTRTGAGVRGCNRTRRGREEAHQDRRVISMNMSSSGGSCGAARPHSASYASGAPRTSPAVSARTCAGEAGQLSRIACTARIQASCTCAAHALHMRCHAARPVQRPGRNVLS